MNLSGLRSLQQEIDAAGMGNPKDRRIKELEGQIAALEERIRWHPYPAEVPPEPSDVYMTTSISSSAPGGFVEARRWYRDRWDSNGLGSVIAWAYLPKPYASPALEQETQAWDRLSDEAWEHIDDGLGGTNTATNQTVKLPPLDSGFGESGKTDGIPNLSTTVPKVGTS